MSWRCNCQSFGPTSRRSWRYGYIGRWRLVFELGFFVGMTVAVEGDHCFVGDFGFANGAFWVVVGRERGALVVDPLVDAGPAVEVAAEGYDRVRCKLQADVAVEAA